MRPKVYVIVLNWNAWADTAACLRSIACLHYENSKCVVVDNGSTDGSNSRIRDEFAQVEIIESGQNLGFAAGCNLGIRHALACGADYVWLLNNDTTVDARALCALVEKAETDPRVGAVGSEIFFMDAPGRVQAWGGGYVNFWLGRSRHFLKSVPDQKIQFLTGASLLTSRRALESVGMLDEGFFMYWEDADYCFRLRRAGWRLAVAGESRVWHKVSASVGGGSVRMDTYFNASAFRFFQKHATAPSRLWIGCSLRLLKRIIARDWERTRAVWVGMTQPGIAPQARCGGDQ